MTASHNNRILTLAVNEFFNIIFSSSSEENDEDDDIEIDILLQKNKQEYIQSPKLCRSYNTSV